MKTFVKTDILAVCTINKYFPKLTSALFTINLDRICWTSPCSGDECRWINPSCTLHSFQQGELWAGVTRQDPALTTAMWLFVQPTCPQLNTDSDRRRMATSFTGIKKWLQSAVVVRKDRIKPLERKKRRMGSFLTCLFSVCAKAKTESYFWCVRGNSPLTSIKKIFSQIISPLVYNQTLP